MIVRRKKMLTWGGGLFRQVCFYPRRTSRRHRHYRNVNRPPVARCSGGTRSRKKNAVQQQPQATRTRIAQLPLCP